MADRAGATITVRVQPNAGRSRIEGFKDGCLRVKVAAPPEKGRANRELISLLSDALEISRGSISIIKGVTSRTKVVAVRGFSRQGLAEFGWEKRRKN